MTIQSNFRKAMENEQQIRALREYIDSHIGGKIYYLTDTNSDLEAGAYEAMTVAVGGAESSHGPTTITASAQELEQWATVAGEPGALLLPEGIHELHIHAKVDAISGKHLIRLYFKIFTYAADTTETEIGVSEESDFLTTTQSALAMHATIDGDIILLATDRLVVKIFANESGAGGDPAVTLYMEGTNSSHYAVPVNIGDFATTTQLNAYTLDNAFDAGKIIDGATSEANAVLIGDPDDYIKIWGEAAFTAIKNVGGYLNLPACISEAAGLHIGVATTFVHYGDGANAVTIFDGDWFIDSRGGGTVILNNATTLSIFSAGNDKILQLSHDDTDALINVPAGDGALILRTGTGDIALQPTAHVTLGGGTHTTDAGDYDLRYDAADGITYDTSDARQKLNKVALEYGLAELLQLIPYRYDYHIGHKVYEEIWDEEEEEWVKTDVVVGINIAEASYPSIGLIAQEIQSVVPELVTEPPDEDLEFWGTKDAILIPILLNGIKDLNAKHEAFKEAVKTALVTTPESYHLFKEHLLDWLEEN